jgi:hypothetical protein
LLFNKKFYLLLLIVALTFAVSCNEKERKIPENKIDINSPETVLKEAKKLLGNDTQIALSGNFDEDTTKEFAAGTEINKPDKWGIQFHLLKQKDNKLEEDFSTNLLDGSFTDAMVRKEKLGSENYDMIYYNSLDYYLGSGGGEVFAYLIDFNRRQTYYSHLFTEKGRRISLFLSENITPEIQKFFLGVFKKDYPNLRIVDKDIDLDE